MEIPLAINEVEPSSESSVDDPLRREIMWETRLETICHKWNTDSSNRSRQHDAKAKQMKKMGACLSVPAIVIPLILSGLTSILTDPLINSSSMVVVSILTGINTFFNYQKKESRHFEYSAKFFKLSTDIEKELAKRKKDRVAADVFLEAVGAEYNQLCFNAPPY